MKFAIRSFKYPCLSIVRKLDMRAIVEGIHIKWSATRHTTRLMLSIHDSASYNWLTKPFFEPKIMEYFNKQIGNFNE